LDYGTSCSAPIIGGFITLINEQRINVGKSTVGFINPVLYSNTRKFNDITVGNNSGCGTGGFSAVTGVSVLSPNLWSEHCNMTCGALEEVAC
jgi:tripeptidyl-peptidase-1